MLTKEIEAKTEFVRELEAARIELSDSIESGKNRGAATRRFNRRLFAAQDKYARGAVDASREFSAAIHAS